MLDRNKTALTHRVTAVAAAYLDGLSCKPVETEVVVQGSWVADVAGIWQPTVTEARRIHMSVPMQKRLGVKANAEYALHVCGDGPLAVVAEVKTTRSDFLSDHKWQRPPPAHFCFLAFPRGVLDPESELPKGWFGLETSEDGTQVVKVHRCCGFAHPMHSGLLLDFVTAVAVRRHHRTKYAATRDWVKAYTAADQEEKKRYSASRLLEGLANWLQGLGHWPDRELGNVLPKLGIKKVPHYLREPVEYFEALRERIKKETP